MLRFFAPVLLITLTSTVCLASEGDDAANAFAQQYLRSCMHNLPNLEAMRKQLQAFPKLPTEKATLFLTGKPGDAWPVPDKHGTFVLALPEGENFCVLYARRANTEVAIQLFTKLVSKPPAPLTAKLVKNEQTQTAANGPTQTIAYEWSAPDVKRRFQFILSTAPSETAQLQVMASAAIVGD
ncbi:NMCC_0638 family (lipo)protein [Pseudomonas vancouverensis]|uniref:Uncharacterized protein n=1 Tax=Pseudomonas vancouverensis TaxID=95300 RepID=A0A1H2NTP0_PSEVA|nr:hypothetical protein [Pseudomonas vancouverensis]KAB0496296.1 hypothetical protein F7R09_11130 [Pseudomonas vancouverensis]TDB64996.1 hypothetical protein EIY72_11305 [Pseudomonas vancouverensis]SDV08837.1 hypothetical protein SAMN05216558_2963 [Pseudomonas vancouverensis]